MATENIARQEIVAPGKLWFGLAATAVAWLTAGFIDLLIVWAACAHQQYAGEGPYSHWRVACFGVGLVLLACAIIAGGTSYRNWRALSQQKNLLDASATDRREFMALLGVIVSITLGMGILLLCVPPFLIQLCERAK